MTAPATAAPVREGLFSVDPPALLGARCRACGALRFPVAAFCAGCQGDDLETIRLATEGELYVFSVIHAAPPGYAGEVPYAVGIVELSDGLRVTSTILAEELEDLAIGDRVSFELLPVGDVVSYAYRRA